MTRHEGKAAIVTGASRGIGLAIAQRLVDEGARVCVTARKPEALEEAVAQLGGAEHAIFAAGSADDGAHQQEAIDRTLEAFGSVNLLVNNAGINPVYGPILEVEPEAAAKIFSVNVTAPLGWTRRVHDAWMGEHGGAIVNVSSITGIRASPGIGFYGVSKAALSRLTVELATELGPGVRVNAVAPGVVKTKFAAALYEGREDAVSAPYPLKRLGAPDDVSGVVSMLLSEDAAWVTGQTVVIDGGITLGGAMA